MIGFVYLKMVEQACMIKKVEAFHQWSVLFYDMYKSSDATDTPSRVSSNWRLLSKQLLNHFS